MATDPETDHDIAYGDAIAEIEAILAEIEDEAVDIDLLAEKVRRASHLIRVCRHRIAGTKIQIDQIVADLDGADDVSDGGIATSDPATGPDGAPG
jgi:exodeoxyribonuclease VII small subunit